MPVGRRTQTVFVLAFDCKRTARALTAEIESLAAAFAFRRDPTAAFAAGAAIRRGEYTRTHLATIVEWKAGGRTLGKLHRDEAEVADALRLAAAAQTDRAALAVLRGLDGIEVAVASAVLTTMDPDRYTIVDFRALESLGQKRTTVYTENYYLDYLDACRALVREHNVPLRTLDKALWQWSWMHKKPGRAACGCRRAG